MTESAIYAVGLVLLHRENPRGGSFGGDFDKKRANRAAASGLTGDELYELLIAVAEKAAEESKHKYEYAKSVLVDEARRQARRSDSLSLHEFVEKWSKP